MNNFFLKNLQINAEYRLSNHCYNYFLLRINEKKEKEVKQQFQRRLEIVRLKLKLKKVAEVRRATKFGKGKLSS